MCSCLKGRSCLDPLFPPWPIGVYGIQRHDGAWVYIGSSSNLRKRISEHCATIRFAVRFGLKRPPKVHILAQCRTVAQAIQTECNFIALGKYEGEPLLNIARPAFRPEQKAEEVPEA